MTVFRPYWPYFRLGPKRPWLVPLVSCNLGEKCLLNVTGYETEMKQRKFTNIQIALEKEQIDQNLGPRKRLRVREAA